MLRILLFQRGISHNSNLRSISLYSAHFNNKHKDSPQIQSSFFKNFTPIYKFEYVRVFSIVNRLKLYNTLFTATVIPSSLILTELEVIHPDNMIYATSIGLASCASLYIVGILANRFIGFIYLNKEENALRIAYLDFWGRRKDVEVPLSDIVPFSEVPVSFTDFLYLKFCRFSGKEVLKVNFKYGIVLDRDKFKKIFPLA